MKRPILLLLISIITFSLGICFAYINYFRANEQKLNSIAFTQKSSNPSWELLLSFENKDLTKIDKEDEKKLRVALNQIGAEISNRTQLGTFSKISNAQGNSFYALIGMIHLLSVPGSCSLQIQLFDLQGKFIKSISFQSCYRMDLISVKVEFIPELDRNVIVAESYRFENGIDAAKQFYGIVNDEFLLIRLENHDGEIIPNHYSSIHMIGTTPPQRSEEQWINSLKSNDIIEVLATLEWLGGKHQGNLVWVGGNRQKIKTEETDFIDKILANETVKLKILEFAQSENKWLQDSANFVLNVKDAEY